MNRKLNVIVACESSATVRDAFRKLGHNAWSCDLLPCDGDPSFHIQGDVLALLQSKQGFARTPKTWDLMIAHPPCTYLCNSGVRWLYGKGKKGAVWMARDAARWQNMRLAAAFFNALWHADIPHIAMENPIMHGHGRALIRDQQTPSQIIQPWWFGHPETKATCLWLADLPKLQQTNPVSPTKGSAIHKLPPSKDRWKIRSKTYQGIADAMAVQWSDYIINGGL